MQPKTFTPLYLVNLSIVNTHALIASSIDFAQSISLDPLAQAALNQTIVDNKLLASRMDNAKRNPLTETIRMLDVERAQCWREIKRTIILNRKSRDTEKANAGENLYIFWHPSWNLNLLPLDVETNLIENLLGRFNANPELVDFAQLLGITPLFEELNGINARFATLYFQRLELDVARGGPSAISLKPAAVHSYTRFCAIIEHTFNLLPTPEIEELFYSLNALRRKYVPLVTKKKVAVQDIEESEVEQI